MRGPKLRVASRASKLARIQTEEVMSAFPELNYTVIAVESYGDKHKDISLMGAVPDDFFTRELDSLLLAGRADIAVHSAKDLPRNLAEGLEIIALTAPSDQSDSLVSRTGDSLKKLKPAAKVGTSSPERKKQILSVRRDLKIVPVRGSVEERIRLVQEGAIDALIVATCALKRMGLSDMIAEVLPFQTHPLQGHLAVLAKNSRADLKVVFSAIDERRRWGRIYLVGAGPGPAEYLTFKADSVLKHSDIIFYDDLTDASVLSRYPCAEKIYAGKRKGKHSFKQNEINEMLHDAAKCGKTASRLKGGDPFIFGRGGEEMSYLEARHIDVDIVPGISAAMASASSARIPLTMRGLSDKLTLLSAHRAEGLPEATDETLVYFMGASNLAALADALIERGLAPETPAAIVYKAGYADEEIITADLEGLKKKKQKSPAMIIVGKTAGLYKRRNRVLFTGLDPFGASLAGHVIHYPLIEIEAMEFSADIAKYDGIVFTSVQAVRVFLKKYYIPPDKTIISIGPRTSRELMRSGYKPAHESPVPDSDILAELIAKLKLKRILYPCSNLSDNKIHRLPSVEKQIIYRTKERRQPKVNLKNYSAVVFTSTSTVDAFLKIYKRIPGHLLLYVYGKHTAGKLGKIGDKKNVQTLQISQG